jgi:transcriptional regulator with XRE-family HTH domain
VIKRSRKHRPRNLRRALLLRQLKAKHNFSLDRIATYIGVGTTLVADYLDGEEIFLSDAVGLSTLFGITLEELACEDRGNFPRRHG